LGTTPADIGQVEKIGDVVIGNAAANFSPGSTGDGAGSFPGSKPKPARPWRSSWKRVAFA